MWLHYVKFMNLYQRQSNYQVQVSAAQGTLASHAEGSDFFFFFQIILFLDLWYCWNFGKGFFFPFFFLCKIILMCFFFWFTHEGEGPKGILNFRGKKNLMKISCMVLYIFMTFLICQLLKICTYVEMIYYSLCDIRYTSDFFFFQSS